MSTISASRLEVDRTLDAPVRFSDYPVILAIVLKPVVDAFYGQVGVQYGYVAFLFVAAFLGYAGRVIAGSKGMADAARANYGRHLSLFSAYFAFLLLSLATYGGSFTEVFKILSPFILILVLAPVVGGWLITTLGIVSLLTILANAALLPFDRGWIYWGAVRTFKGFYYFKTDLAYAVSFSLFAVALWQRFRFTPILIAAALVATAEVVLANSRLNYLLFASVLIFIAVKGGMRPWSIVRYAVLFTILGIISTSLYDTKQFLTLDFSNIKKFTSGRSGIWAVLIEQGVLSYSPFEMLFGRGMFADVSLFAENVFSGLAYDAHNEWIHFIITQGVVGLTIYCLLWWSMYRYVASHSTPQWLKGVSLFSFALIGMQSMTAVVSSYSSKTWPLVFILLTVSSANRREQS